MLSVSPRRRNRYGHALRRRGTSPMLSRTGSLQLRQCGSSEIGIGDSRDGKDWPAGEMLLASVPGPHSTHYLLAIPDPVLEGAVLPTFPDRVAPFGRPPPPSRTRA